MIYEYRFWKEWCDEEGRLWAEPYIYESATDARRDHKAAMNWLWCAGKHRPSVSDLFSIAYREDPSTGKKREDNRSTIQTGGSREYHEATLSGLRAASERKPVPAAHAKARAAASADSSDTPF